MEYMLVTMPGHQEEEKVWELRPRAGGRVVTFKSEA